MSLVLPLRAAEQQVSVHPSGASVPENLLRIELRLARPLHGALDMGRVQLLDSEGGVIEDALLDLPLLGADGRSITLLLHPARVKTGLAAQLSLGRALQAGSVLTLRIDDPVLGLAVLKRWRVSPADHEGPQPQQWTVQPPQPQRRDSLRVQLDGAVGASAAALIAVRGPDGRRVPGRGRLAEGETVWLFMPARPWRPGRHQVLVHPELEDPAGNRSCAPFEALPTARAACDAAAMVVGPAFEVPSAAPAH